MKNIAQIPELTHIILTRFNTAIDYAPSARGIDDAWLRERILLFERYCLPSVTAQSCARFSWLVFCDARSPQWFRARIAAYGPLLTPVYIEGAATDEVIARSVKETGLVSTPYLITTRLDNDDAIGNQYISLVQKAFARQDRLFLVFPFGLQSFRGQLYNVHWRSNPFLSLIEKVRPNQEFTTVLCVPHNKVRSTGDVRDIYAAPQWLQVLHGGNLLNSLRGWPRLSSKYPTQFPVNWPPDRQDETFVKRFCVSGAALFARGRMLAKKFWAGSGKGTVHNIKK